MFVSGYRESMFHLKISNNQFYYKYYKYYNIVSNNSRIATTLYIFPNWIDESGNSH